MQSAPAYPITRPAATRTGRFLNWVLVLQLFMVGVTASALLTGWHRGWDVLQPSWAGNAAQAVLFIVTFVIFMWGRRLGLRYGMGFLGLIFAGVFGGVLDAHHSSFFFVIGILTGMAFGGMLDLVFRLRDDKKRGYEIP
jgi:hypothetical protein